MSAATLSMLATLTAAPALATVAATRTIDSACPSSRVLEYGFLDVPTESVHKAAIDCLVHWQVANGTSSTGYTPAGPVTRAQLSSLIARMILSTGGQLPTATRDHFQDDNGSTHEGSINQLAEAGILLGRQAGVYDAASPVSRAQLAAVVVRAYDYRAGQEGQAALPEGDDVFRDDEDSPLQAEIDKAAAAGLIGGYGDGSFRPGTQVRRDQSASVLARTLDVIVERGMATVPQPPVAPPGSIPGDDPVTLPEPEAGPSQPRPPVAPPGSVPGEPTSPLPEPEGGPS